MLTCEYIIVSFSFKLTILIRSVWTVNISRKIVIKSCSYLFYLLFHCAKTELNCVMQTLNSDFKKLYSKYKT